MNVQDVSAHWVALHEVLGLGAAIANEAEYLRVLAGVDDHPLWGLIGLAGDRIREYEGRVHPWPDTSTPATVMAGLMRQHGLRQSDLPEVGSQGVVSEVLAGKRTLNARQVKSLAQRFKVAAEVLLF